MNKDKTVDNRLWSPGSATHKQGDTKVASPKTADTERSAALAFNEATRPLNPPGQEAGALPQPAGDARNLSSQRQMPAGDPGTEMAPPTTVPPELLALVNRLDGQLEVALDAVGALRQGVEAAGAQRHELLDEARAVNRNYKELVDKIAGERDQLAHELRQARSQFSADAGAQAEAFTAIQHELKKERREVQLQLRQADDEISERNGRIEKLETQLLEALASRDRIAERARAIEARLEGAVVPLREEVERARAREARARRDLEAAHEEIAALKLLAGGPGSQ